MTNLSVLGRPLSDDVCADIRQFLSAHSPQDYHLKKKEEETDKCLLCFVQTNYCL